MSSYSEYQALGTDVNGRIYITDSTGTSAGILYNLTNDGAGAAAMIGLVLRSVPRVSSGSVSTDSILGYRVFINSTAGTDGDLTGSTEVTQYAVDQVRRTTTATLVAGVVTMTRLAHDMVVELDAGGLLQNFQTLTVDGIQSGDLITFYAKAGTSFVCNFGAGNMTSGVVNADYTSAGVAQRITVQYNGTTWNDAGRVEQNPVSVSDMVAAGIPFPISGIQNVALNNAGQTVTLDPRTDKGIIKLTGGPYATVANNVFTGSNLGTELVGDKFEIWSNGVVDTYTGGSILVGAKTVPSDSALAGGWKATLVCTSIGPSVWTCESIEFDSSVSQIIQTAHIKDLNVTTGKINDLAVTTGKVADLAVTGAKIANGTISAGKYAAGSISTADLDAALQSSLGSNVQIVKVTIPSANVLTMNAAPVLVIAAPGAGKYIDIITTTGRIVFNTTVYTTNLGVVLNNGVGTQSIVSSTTMLGAAATRIVRFAGVTGTATGLTEQYIENTAVYAEVPVGNPGGGGDSDLELYIAYREVTL